jgi:secreted PhoX family phosphatase
MSKRTARPRVRDRGHGGDTFAAILRQRLSRRGLLRVGAVVGTAAATAPLLEALGATPAAAQSGAPTPVAVKFTPIALSTADTVQVAAGHQTQAFLLWGDPLRPGLPPFDLNAQTAALQEQRVGFNHDFLAFLPLPFGSERSDEGLLWINHEYTSGREMFPTYNATNPSKEHVDIELAAHGATVVKISRNADLSWTYDVASPLNRRLTATTPMLLTGPAAGSELLKTADDPTGTLVLGMLNNCSGGVTPWGTVLTCEENFNQYFANVNALPSGTVKSAHQRYGLPSGASSRRWENYYPRFNTAQHPNEPFRFGWVVEVDPYDPSFQPRKRTALGRLKHEAATVVVAPSGQVVVYSGDDERFDYLYKFVSAGTYNASNRQANFGLLDSGTLYVARFNPDGTGQWLPLVFGQGPLTAANGFTSQADVLVRTRLAADALGATKMDRPEDVETNPKNGKVYVVLTNNTSRGVGSNPGTDPANPRANNRYGHILEITEDDYNPAGTTFRWEVFLLCGPPSDASTYFAGFPRELVSAIGTPDNIAFDRRGNLWIATDGQPETLNANDGVFAVATDGTERGWLKQFLSGPRDCEICGPTFTPDNRTFFCAIQHPGEGGGLTPPTSTWPTGSVPRPAVVAVWRTDGLVIGA